YSMDSGGDERTQLYRLHGVGGGTDHAIGDGWTSDDLTRQPKAIHTFGGWSHDGDRIAFSATRDDPSRFDVYTLKIGDKEPKLLAKGPGGYYRVVGWSPDDSTLLLLREESSAVQELHLCDVATGKVRVLGAGNCQYHSPCWSADGKSVFCSSDG